MPLKPPLESFAVTHAKDSDMPRKIHAEAAQGFGERLAALRKAANITQTAFAEEIGISQRMMAYYESPAAHPPANLLPAMAKTLGVSVDALLGLETSKRRAKATDTRLARRLMEIEKLDVRQKRQVMQFLDTFIENAKLKRKAHAANNS
jgi:transcriptional regulator with XRE-family HTH domain